MGTHSVKVARIYREAAAADGARVLVDRLWPRGMSKERAELTEWCRSVAPSTELRQWYDHDPDKFEEFARRYRDELASGEQAEALEHLAGLADAGPLTLLTASRRDDISAATVLAQLLNET